MKLICSWCKVSMEPSRSECTQEQKVSHGICKQCLGRLMAGSGQPMQEFIDSIQTPVFVVDGNARVISANRSAENFLGADRQSMQGKLGGEVFSCENHQLPGGCGQTIHCKACTIRRCITYTSRTGKSLSNVPAYMDLDNIDGAKEVAFKITTQKRDQVITLEVATVGIVQKDE